jgi:hypothetical protein
LRCSNIFATKVALPVEASKAKLQEENYPILQGGFPVGQPCVLAPWRLCFESFDRINTANSAKSRLAFGRGMAIFHCSRPGNRAATI